MWFRLKNANFANVEGEPPKNLGTMTGLRGSYFITWSVTGGLTKTNCPSYVVYDKETKKATLTATLTLAEGAELSGTPSSTSGTITHTVSETTVTITITDISENCTVTIAATGSSTGGDGGNTGGNGGNTGSDSIPTEPADVLQLNAFRYDEDVTINSGGDTSTKTGYNTFYEIPVLPSSVYYIPGAVRVALLNSSKAYRDDYNIYTDSGSNVGQASYVATDANTAFLNITVLESKCAIEDAKIQIAHIATTIKDTKTLASTGATLVTGKKLNSSSYTEADDENYIIYKDIPVTADATYKIAGSARVWFLAEDKITTKGSTNPTTGGVPEKFCFKVPGGAAYASASIYKNNMDKSAEELELHELTVAYSV